MLQNVPSTTGWVPWCFPLYPNEKNLLDAYLLELMPWSGERAFRKTTLVFLLVPAGATGTGNICFSRGLCSAAILGTQLILLLPRCSQSCYIFSSSLLCASLQRHLIIHFKTWQLLARCPLIPFWYTKEEENEAGSSQVLFLLSWVQSLKDFWPPRPLTTPLWASRGLTHTLICLML